MTYTADPKDRYVLVANDHGVLSLPDIKAVRQPHAIPRAAAEEVLSLPEATLIEATGLFIPFYEAAQAPAKLQRILPPEFLRSCGELQQSFAQVRSTIALQAAFFFDLARTKAHARPFHIEQSYYPGSPAPARTIRARGLIASFSDASLAMSSGGETQMVFTNTLTPEQTLSIVGNADPLGAPSLDGITIESLDACEALSFWGDSYENENPYTDFLIHRARPAGSKRFSLALSARHSIDGFDL